MSLGASCRRSIMSAVGSRYGEAWLDLFEKTLVKDDDKVDVSKIVKVLLNCEVLCRYCDANPGILCC